MTEHDVYAWRDPQEETAIAYGRGMAAGRADESDARAEERYSLIDAVDRVQWYALALAFCAGLLIGIWIP